VSGASPPPWSVSRSICLKDAIRRVELGTNHPTTAVRKHIIKRAHEINPGDLIAKNWNAEGASKA
jgi:hypothetical protein